MAAGTYSGEFVRIVRSGVHSEELRALYLRNSHIAQPATKIPPKNIAKQYRP